MQSMTYFFCASLSNPAGGYIRWGTRLPPLILICSSPPEEVGVISHLIYPSALPFSHPCGTASRHPHDPRNTSGTPFQSRHNDGSHLSDLNRAVLHSHAVSFTSESYASSVNFPSAAGWQHSIETVSAFLSLEAYAFSPTGTHSMISPSRPITKLLLTETVLLPL